MRVLEELRGTSASLSAAAKRSSIGSDLSRAIALSRARRPENFLASLRRLSFFSTELFFAILSSLLSSPRLRRPIGPSLPERKIERGQQRPRLVVGLGRGADHDIHAPDFGRLVVVDLGEHDVLLDADRAVAATVEALRVEAAEVAHARQRDIDQPIDELVHARLAQGDLAADRLVLAQLEVGDRLARLGDHSLLAGDQAEIGSRRFHLLAIGDALADAHVDDDLVERRHLHRILVAELIGQRLAHDLVVVRAQARRHARLRRRSGLGRGGRLLALGALPLASASPPLGSLAGLAWAWSPLGFGGLSCFGLSAFGLSAFALSAFALSALSLSAIDLDSRALGEAHLLAVAALAHELEADAGRLAVLGIGQRQVGQMDRPLLGDDPTLLVGGLALVALDHVDAAHQRAAFGRPHFDHLAGAALVAASEHDHLVALLDLGRHHRTSGASEMIFMWFLARSSRGTGPKMRVPTGSICGLISTAALRSKRMIEPSGRRMSLRTRTTTAFITSPFFTRPRGIASLTETTITSPIVAYLRFEPPSTLMHMTRRAPELSATSRLVCI